MFGIGTGELLIIFLLALLLFGPQKLPEIARWMGRAVREARKAWSELQREIMSVNEESDEVTR